MDLDKPTYVSIAFGPGKKYGLILPCRTREDLLNLSIKETTGRLNICYNGNSADEAAKAIRGLSSLPDLLIHLEQHDLFD